MKKVRTEAKKLHLKMYFVERWTKGKILFDWKQDEKRKMNDTKRKRKISWKWDTTNVYIIEEKLEN